ncbi:M23 family metallopeptidase [Bacteroidota bacterium]
MLQLSKKTILIIFFILSTVPFNSQGQENYFFPVKPGENNYLSGTMGEIRNSHFHGGIDIKTGGTSGLAVYATFDGYVSRIRISANGYGNSLYIKHPDGETSVYGHLFRLRRDIADWVRNEQYKKESFEVNLFPDRDRFPVMKGDLIALSGNTGSSQGPHLHFEIRDKEQQPVNPLKRNFLEIKDNVPPVAQRIALTTLSMESRVNNQFGRFEFDLKKKENVFLIEEPIKVNGLIGVQIKAYDKMNGASNRNGIPFIGMTLDGEKLFEIRIDTISFNETRHVVIHYDYEAKMNKKGTYEKLYLDDGNPLPLYYCDEKKGKILIEDTLDHEITVTLKDAYNNTSVVNIPFKGYYTDSMIENIALDIQNDPGYLIIENIMVIGTVIEDETSNNLQIFSNRMKYELLPSYTSQKKAVYLWDLRFGMPDSVSICDKKAKFNFQVAIPSETSFNFYNRFFDLSTRRLSLYDTVYLEACREINENGERFIIGSDKIPVKRTLNINLKPVLEYPDTDHAAVYKSFNGNGDEYIGGKWDNGQISFESRSFGEFTILTDTIPPYIKPLRIKTDKISFRINDELSGIKKYEARLNGKWLLMNYDPKRSYIWSDPLDKNKSLSGELILTVEDNSGNIRTYQTTIN